jgi:hypothetical protein
MLIYEHQNFYLKAPALCLKSTGFTHSSIWILWLVNMNYTYFLFTSFYLCFIFIFKLPNMKIKRVNNYHIYPIDNSWHTTEFSRKWFLQSSNLFKFCIMGIANKSLHLHICTCSKYRSYMSIVKIRKKNFLIIRIINKITSTFKG